MGFKVKLLNREAVMAKLIQVVPEAEKDLAAAQIASGKMLVNRIRPRAPYRSGHYRRSIESDLLSNRPNSQRTLVGLKGTKDKNAVGIFAPFIWRFLEFGTVHQKAQPHIFPTYRAARKTIRRNMANAVNKAVRRHKKAKGL